MSTPAEPRFFLYPEGWQKAGIATVDWATGSIRWFITAGEYEDLMDAAFQRRDFNEWHGDLVEIWVHELEHLVQIASCGFAYDLSRRMYDIVFEAASTHASLGRIHRNRAGYVDRLRQALTALDRRGPDDVTARHLLEGMAFLRQKRLFADHMTHAAFVAALDGEDPLYRHAYDVASDYLGDQAILHFAQVADLALYTSRPELIFVPLLERFASKASRLGRAANHQVGTDLLGDRFPSLVLGPAASQRRAGRRHPAVDRTVERLNAWVRSGAKDNRFFNLHAGFAPLEVTALASASAFFPPDEEGRTPILLAVHDQTIESDGRNMSFFRYLCAVSAILQEELPDPDTVPLAPRTPRTATAQPDAPLSAKVMYFSHDDVQRPEQLEMWAGTLLSVSAEPAAARAYRGTCFLTFGGLDGWHPELADPELGAFVRGLFDRVPHLLYFLSEGPTGDAAVSVVLGAFFPDDTVEMPDGAKGFRVGQHTADMLVSLFRAAADFADRMGEARSVVLRHLDALPPVLADHVRAGLVR